MDQDFGASLAMQPVKMEGVKMETRSAAGDPPPESDRQSEQEQIEKTCIHHLPSTHHVHEIICQDADATMKYEAMTSDESATAAASTVTAPASPLLTLVLEALERHSTSTCHCGYQSYLSCEVDPKHTQLIKVLEIRESWCKRSATLRIPGRALHAGLRTRWVRIPPTFT